ncbi:HEAT repeat domain-containing protein [Primorskyibacter marinus]|uniref:HEAT repeat domain-containing protein n=1 Tax=Primorskyibacter marinus TaxID=1977320 RepID=UPI0013008717|nr:HEAT repeat domain-containing protein [Primorskyibacter marinus]
MDSRIERMVGMVKCLGLRLSSTVRHAGTCGIIALAVGLGNGAAAQTSQNATQSFEEFQASVTAGAQRIAKYQEVLQNPDARIQYEAVRLLLKSGDPALVRIAKEHALFSTNPVLRNSAILAIFEAGGNLRIEVTATDESSAKVLKWVSDAGGTHDGKKGNHIFNIGAKAENCWMSGKERYAICELTVSGTSVQFKSNRGQGSQASLALGPDGVLRGVIFAEGGKANAAIDLKE